MLPKMNNVYTYNVIKATIGINQIKWAAVNDFVT